MITHHPYYWLVRRANACAQHISSARHAAEHVYCRAGDKMKKSERCMRPPTSRSRLRLHHHRQLNSLVEAYFPIMNDSERSQSFVDISPVYHQPLFHITSNFLQCQTPCSISAVTDIGSCGSNSRKRQCSTQPECSACSPSTSIPAFMNTSPCKLPLFAVVLSNTWHPPAAGSGDTQCVFAQGQASVTEQPTSCDQTRW